MKVKHPDMTKACPIFECIPVIAIMDQSDIEPENEEASFHSNEENNNMAYHGEEEKFIEEEQYG